MRGVIRAVLVAFTLSAAFTAPAAAGPYEDAAAAVERGDFETAFRLWQPFAEHGNAKAQYNLGLMYHSGKGVAQHYAEAVKWYRRAAEQGHAIAQHNLAFMYSSGKGGKQDHVQAYMWFSLAAAKGNKKAKENRDTIAKRMSRAQIDKARRLARQWRPQ